LLKKNPKYLHRHPLSFQIRTSPFVRNLGLRIMFTPKEIQWELKEGSIPVKSFLMMAGVALKDTSLITVLIGPVHGMLERTV
jgi:hypothetical protein